MAKVSFQLDPAAGGVSQEEFDTHVAGFDAHTHNYDKMTSCNKMSFCDPLTHTETQTGAPSGGS